MEAKRMDKWGKTINPAIWAPYKWDNERLGFCSWTLKFGTYRQTNSNTKCHVDFEWTKIEIRESKGYSLREKGKIFPSELYASIAGQTPDVCVVVLLDVDTENCNRTNN